MFLARSVRRFEYFQIVLGTSLSAERTSVPWWVKHTSFIQLPPIKRGKIVSAASDGTAAMIDASNSVQFDPMSSPPIMVKE